MVNKTAILSVRIVTDAKQGQQGINDYRSTLDKLGGTMQKMAIPAGITIAALGAVANAAVDAASKLQQSAGAVESVFGVYAGEVKKLADDAAENVGLAASEYQQLAAVLGSQLKNLGTPMEAVADQTDELISLGADLAATYGGTTADAVAALSSLMRGERDPIERYGVSIKQATIEAKKAELGLSGLTGQADANADATATLALLYEQTSAAAGQFARETDTVAGAQQIATAKWEDAQAALGEKLLPYMTTFAEVAADVADVIAENSDAFTIIAAVIGTVAAVILILNVAMQLATVAQWAWNAAMLANPIGLVIIIIGLLIAIIVVLVANWETVGKVFEDVINAIVDWWNGLVDSFANGFDQIVGWIQDVIGWFQQLFGWQSQTASAGTVSTFAAPSLTARAASPAGVGPAPFAMPASRRAAPAPAGLTINVSGALDPDATARQIRRVVTGFERKQGAIYAGGRTWR